MSNRSFGKGCGHATAARSVSMGRLFRRPGRLDRRRRRLGFQLGGPQVLAQRPGQLLHAAVPLFTFLGECLLADGGQARIEAGFDPETLLLTFSVAGELPPSVPVPELYVKGQGLSPGPLALEPGRRVYRMNVGPRP